MTFSSCTVSPQPIKVGVDNCEYCKMTISDNRFGAEIVTNKGRVYKFGEAHCLSSFLKEDGLNKNEIKDIYLTDFCGEHVLSNQKSSYFFKSEALRSPMGGNVASFSDKDSMKYYSNKVQGQEITWDQILK